MADPHCRIGKIRAKSGAVLRVLPDLAKRNAKEAWTEFDGKLAHIRGVYANDLDGFILIAWNRNGFWNCSRRPGHAQHGNSLPDFARGAVQRQLSYEDAAELLEDTLRNR